jgi:GNAT superfamily N-acetyltransferase
MSNDRQPRGQPDQTRIELLDRSRHHREGFDCGVAVLNQYLQRQARQDSERNQTRVWVWAWDDGEVIGYFSLASASISLGDLPEEMRKKLGKYQDLPMILLGRLAIDQRYQGQRLGATLLGFALRKVIEVNTIAAAWGVVVDAIGDDAVRFYQRYGFQVLEGNRLYASIALLKEALDESS